MGNDQVGPVAVRDYPKGSPMLLLPKERARLVAEQTRSRRRRRLLQDNNDANSDGSQGDRPSHASVSLPSSYHDASPNPASFSAHPQPASAPTTPFGTQVPGSTASSEQSQPSSRAGPSSAPTQPPTRQEPPRCDNICQTQNSPTDFVHHLWMTYSVHEQHNIQLGLPMFTTYGAAALAHSGMPESEIREYNSCRHAFPHVPQNLFPMSRLDGLPGQYFHLTQIPFGTDIDPVIGLSRSYQILICFDSGYNEMRKDDVQEAARARFEAMDIALATRFCEPVSALINHHNKTWLGFIKVDLHNLERDAITLLKGNRVFTLQVQNSEYVVGKVEKGFEFSSTANNCRVGLGKS
jgi:hypothetical protein